MLGFLLKELLEGKTYFTNEEVIALKSWANIPPKDFSSTGRMKIL
jgi:hypothetical protein